MLIAFDIVFHRSQQFQIWEISNKVISLQTMRFYIKFAFTFSMYTTNEIRLNKAIIVNLK